MPVIITPVDLYPAAFTTIADGDAISQANFVQNMQEFADAITYLRNRTIPSGSLVISAALGGPGGTVGGTFTFDTANSLWSGPSPAPALPASIAWGINLGAVLPAGGPFQVSSIEAWTISTTTHGGLDPATPQGIRLDYRDPASGSTALQNVVIQLDPSPAATLDTLHSFSASGLGHSIIPGASYFIRWICESGANAQPTDIHAFNITVEAV